MQTQSSNPSNVQKELVKFLHFPKADVLTDQSERDQRRSDLNKATKLGNLNHTKVKIIFSDIHGLKVISTTIWATTEKNISLKQGNTIPINRIVGIQFV